MNNTLIGLLKFIKDFEPELHCQEYGSNDIIIFIYSFQVENFMNIYNNFDDENYTFIWRNGYLAFVLNEFLENICEISTKQFLDLVK